MAIRTTQVAVEVLVNSSSVVARTTQVAAEVLIQAPKKTATATVFFPA
jgi:hypothetical protein